MEFTHKENGPIDIIYLVGELELYSSPFLQEKLDELLAKNRKKTILCLKELAFVDSSGLKLFFEGAKRAKLDSNCYFIFTDINSAIAHVFNLGGFHNLCTIFPRVEDAIKFLEGL
ncbi:MAG: STAS domain-containing protein [Leptospiraceae bacterium]|nr:STAS domain-containing protein [Leptospiraceae bacterium]MCP5496925.1 STAS domain-containing protein [Leptospiraceae bacterium]